MNSSQDQSRISITKLEKGKKITRKRGSKTSAATYTFTSTPKQDMTNTEGETTDSERDVSEKENLKNTVKKTKNNKKEDNTLASILLQINNRLTAIDKKLEVKIPELETKTKENEEKIEKIETEVERDRDNIRTNKEEINGMIKRINKLEKNKYEESDRENLVREIAEIVTAKMSTREDSNNGFPPLRNLNVEKEKSATKNNDPKITFASISAKGPEALGARPKVHDSRQRKRSEGRSLATGKEEDTTDRIFRDNDRILRAMFSEASTKVGLFPMQAKDVKFVADPTRHSNLQGDSDRKVLYDPEYYLARLEAAYDFIETDLRMSRSIIEVNDCHMCIHPKNKILWIRVHPDHAKKLFMAAARAMNNQINVFQFIPPPAIERKRELGKMLTTFRKMDESLRTQIRIGEKDIEVWAKHYTKGEYTPFIKVGLEIIDPLNTLPLVKTQGKEIDPRHRDFIKEKLKDLDAKRPESEQDEAGFRRPKRKERTPEKINAAKRRNLNSTPEKRLKNINDFLMGIRNPSNEMVEDHDEFEDNDLMDETDLNTLKTVTERSETEKVAQATEGNEAQRPVNNEDKNPGQTNESKNTENESEVIHPTVAVEVEPKEREEERKEDKDRSNFHVALEA